MKVRPRPRRGYNFDGCPPEVVLTRMSVKDGRLVLPDGMSYRMLVLPQVETMTPRLLRKIRELVEAGATVLGAPPAKSPSLQDYPKCDEEVKALAGELWGDGRRARRTDRAAVRQGPRHLAAASFSRSRTRLTTARSAFERGQVDLVQGRQSGPQRAAGQALLSPRRHRGRRQPDRIRAAGDDRRQHVRVLGQRPAGRRRRRLSPRLRDGRRSAAQARREPHRRCRREHARRCRNPAGLVGALTIKYRDGRTQEVRTDGAWEAAKTCPSNWTADAAPAHGWSAAMELGPMGMAPWGDVEESPAAVDEIPDIAIPSRVLAADGRAAGFQVVDEPCATSTSASGETDVYFVANPEPREVEALCTFRVSGKRPELWWPDTGRIVPAAAYEMKDDCTSVPLRFDPSGSVFVVFRTAPLTARQVAGGKNWDEFQPVQEISGPWEVSFDPKWGGPAKVTFDKLDDWSKRPEDGIRYYSGTASTGRRSRCPSRQPPSIDCSSIAAKSP